MSRIRTTNGTWFEISGIISEWFYWTSYLWMRLVIPWSQFIPSAASISSDPKKRVATRAHLLPFSFDEKESEGDWIATASPYRCTSTLSRSSIVLSYYKHPWTTHNWGGISSCKKSIIEWELRVLHYNHFVPEFFELLVTQILLEGHFDSHTLSSAPSCVYPPKRSLTQEVLHFMVLYFLRIDFGRSSCR